MTFQKTTRGIGADMRGRGHVKNELQMFRYVRPHLRSLGITLITIFAAIGLEVLRPWPMKILVDVILGDQPLPEELGSTLGVLPWSVGTTGLLFWVCVSTVLIFLVGTLMSIARNFVTVGLGQRITYSLGADLFLHLQRLSLMFHNRRPVGDTISRVTGDVYCLQIKVTSVLLPLLQSFLTLITLFVIMWHLQPVMTLLSLGVVPFLLLSIHIFGKPMKDRSRERRDLEGRMMSLVQQTLSAIPAVQAFSREELEHARFCKYCDETVVAYQRSTLAGMWFKLAVGLVTALGTASIMWIGARYALNGRMTVGTILVFLSYLASLYEPLNAISYSASTWQGASASTDRVLEILNIPKDVQDLPEAADIRIRGSVRYDRVTFGYEPGKEVLHNISFETKPGEVIAVVGPTGSGKTTLVNLLVRFFDPWFGSVTVDGHDIRRIKVRSLRQQMAMVLQESFIFPLTVAENIAYGRPDATLDEIRAAAEAANADQFIRRLPEGYLTVVGERGATLSGGEKQRLSIARAFLMNAPVLILDEPTSALDAGTESLLLDSLKRLMKDRTTFIISHRLSTIRNADRILVIKDGEIVEQGTHEDLVAQGRLYAHLYSQQNRVLSTDSHWVSAEERTGGQYHLSSRRHCRKIDGQ